MYAILSNNNDSTGFETSNKTVFSDKKYLIQDLKLDSEIYITISGTIFYYLEGNVKKSFQKTDFPTICCRLYKKKKIRFLFDLEGEFWGYIKDKRSNIYYIFSDIFSRKKVYYSLHKNQELIISDNIWEIIKNYRTMHLKINKNSFRSFLIKGYVPAGFTLLENISRIRPGFLLKYFSESNMLIALDNRKILKSRNYKKKDLQVYEKLLEEAIETRKSKNNVVYISGGLDSAVLLAILYKSRINNTVSAATWAILSNDNLINQNEIYRATRLCEHYGISLKIRKLDYSKINFHGHFQTMINQGMTEFFHLGKPIHYMLKKDNSPETSVFLGQQSNSIHNFRLTGGNIGRFPYLLFIQNYPAKLWNYLWSPVFLRRLKNGNYNFDFFFRLLGVYMNFRDFTKLKVDIVKENNPKKFLEEYYSSFLLSGNLAPFNKEKKEFSILFNNSSRVDFKKWCSVNFFSDPILHYSEAKHYSILTKIDRDFHLQGSDSAVIYSASNSLKTTIGMPFDDRQLVEFVERMPENWGRSLELRRPRYPLIQVAKKKDLPFHKINYYPSGDFSETHLYKAIMTGETKTHIQSLLREALKREIYKELWTKGEWLQVKKILNKFFDKTLNHEYYTLLNRISYLCLIYHKIQDILEN